MENILTPGKQVVTPHLLRIILKWKQKLSANIFLLNPLPPNYCSILAEELITGIILLNSFGKKFHYMEIPSDRLFENIILKISYLNQVFHTSLFTDLLRAEIKIDNGILGKIYLPSNKKLKKELSELTPESYGIIYGYLRYKRSVNDNPVKTGRKTGIVYYTPEYIVDYIIEETIGKKLRENPQDISNLKIYDPACGSGIFLLKSYDYLVSHLNKAGYVTLEKKKEIISQNLFGTDIDLNSIELVKISLLMKLSGGEENIAYPDLSQNFDCLNFLFEETTLFDHFSGKFDIIIGNPPYYTGINENEKKILRKNIGRGSTESAALFMHLADDKLSDNGINGFIIPKTFVYSSAWENLRQKFLPGLTMLIDCGKAWKEVNIEQVIYFYEKGSANSFYYSGIRKNNEIIITGKIEKHLYNEFGLLLNGISDEELETGLIIKNAGLFLNEAVTNHRGAKIQKLITGDKSDFIVLGGKQILSFTISNDLKGYLPLEKLDDSKAIIKDDSILVQNIVMHSKTPAPYIKIIAALSSSFSSRDYLITDTVNQLQNKGIYSSGFICAVLNSRLMSWYIYNFIFGRAVRVMHFDNYVTKRIPLPLINFNNPGQKNIYDKIEMLVEKIVEKKRNYQGNGTVREKLMRKNTGRSIKKIIDEIDKLIFTLYCIEESKINLTQSKEIISH